MSDATPQQLTYEEAREELIEVVRTLQRGYAVLQDADWHVVTSVAQATVGAAVSVRVADGRIHATTDRIEEAELVEEDPHA